MFHGMFHGWKCVRGDWVIFQIKNTQFCSHFVQICNNFVTIIPTGMVGNASKIHKFANPTIFSAISESQYVVYAMLYNTIYSNYLNCAYNTIQFIKLWPV